MHFSHKITCNFTDIVVKNTFSLFYCSRLMIFLIDHFLIIFGMAIIKKSAADSPDSRANLFRLRNVICNVFLQYRKRDSLQFVTVCL
jgi:hypothetical protein